MQLREEDVVGGKGGVEMEDGLREEKGLRKKKD